MNASKTSGQVTAYVVLATVSLFLGYWAGVQSHRSVKNIIPHEKNTSDDDSSYDSDASSTDGDVDNSAALCVDKAEECKLVLVVRSDLGMTSGKIAAQYGYPFIHHRLS
ncbi:hypothetical protein C0992_007194 [Termitomyces sp. T32_za158]|nr:hypothetical protein C0992_007194 [Termitomyces sp. T32_za158]